MIHSIVEHEVWDHLRSRVAHQVHDQVLSRTWTQVESQMQDRVEVTENLIWGTIRDHLEQDLDSDH